MNELERIKAEEDRLLSIFSNLDENELAVASGLIKQAAFMQITLEDLQTVLREKGSVDNYRNGEHQYGVKQSAELQAYNQTMRTYNSVMSKLLKIVPMKIVYEETIAEKWDRIRREKDNERMTPEEYDKWHKDFCDLLHKDRETREESDR